MKLCMSCKDGKVVGKGENCLRCALQALTNRTVIEPLPTSLLDEIGSRMEVHVHNEWKEEEKPKLSHYPNAKIDDTREVDGVTWRVVAVEDDTTVWWGKGAYAKMEVCCPPLPPRDESYGRKSKVKDLATGQPVLWRDIPAGKAADALKRFMNQSSVFPYRSWSQSLRVPLDDLENYTSSRIVPLPISFTYPILRKP